MDILLCSVVVFGLVILLHELGHFVAAKLVGIRVITVSIGLGPRLWKRRIGDTLYCISAIPLGGYVRPFAAVDEATSAALRRRNRALLPFLMPLESDEIAIASSLEVEDPGNLFQKGFWPRSIFILAGVAFNIIFAFAVVFAAFLSIPHSKLSEELKIGKFMGVSPSADAGLKVGDIIQSINGVRVNDWSILYKKIQATKGEPTALEVVRKSSEGAKTVSATLLPRKIVGTFRGKNYSIYTFGFYPERSVESTSVPDGLVLSTRAMYKFAKAIVGINEALPDRDSDKEDSSASNYGLIGGALGVGFAASKSWLDFAAVFAILSLSIVLFNILPFPALDGGAFVTLVLQKVFRIPISLAVEQRLTYGGLVVTALLALFSLGADIFHSLVLVMT